MIEIKAEDKIYSSGVFNMQGQEIEQDHNTIKPNGRLMFGSNFILENGNNFQYVIQMTPDNTTRKIDLKCTKPAIR